MVRGGAGVGFAPVRRDAHGAGEGDEHGLRLDRFVPWRGLEDYDQWRLTLPHVVLVEEIAPPGPRRRFELSPQAPSVVSFHSPGHRPVRFEEFLTVSAVGEF